MREAASKFMSMTVFKPMSELQHELPEVLDMIESSGERVVVIRGDRPTAVMMSFENYEGLIETLDILSSPGASGEIREAEARYDTSDYASADDIRSDLERRASEE